MTEFFTDVTHATVKEEPVDYAGGKTHRPGASCVLVYFPEDKIPLFSEHRLVYCHALRDDDSRSPVRIQLGNLAGAVVCGYRGPRDEYKTSIGWIAPILSCEVLSREALKTVLEQAGWPSAKLPKTSSAYLLFRLGVSSSSLPRKLEGLTPRGSYQAVSCTLEKLNACPRADESI